jgi:hypothetical protein
MSTLAPYISVQSERLGPGAKNYMFVQSTTKINIRKTEIYQGQKL